MIRCTDAIESISACSRGKDTENKNDQRKTQPAAMQGCKMALEEAFVQAKGNGENRCDPDHYPPNPRIWKLHQSFYMR